MIQLVLNKKYNYINGFIHTFNTKGDFSPEINFNINIDEFHQKVEIDETKIDPKIWSQVIGDPYSFVFIDGQFKSRPFLKIDALGQESNIRDDSSSVAKINQEHKLVLTLYNPDNVETYLDLTKIKLKDRNEFLSLDFTEAELVDGKYQFSVISQFPGIAILRPKDEEIAAHFFLHQIKFKQ